MESEKSELNALERFLIWFLVPIVFAVVLIMVLLTMFGYDTKGNLLSVAHKIPIVQNWVPKENTDTSGNGAAASATASDKLKEKDALIQKLQKQLKDQEADLKKSQDNFLRKDDTLKELQTKYDALVADQQQTSDEAYGNKVSELSKLYAGMNPGKAAPILQNMTLSERVLVLSGMKVDQQALILEKMTPAIAAETSARLKEEVPSKDLQIAALQERVKKLETDNSSPAANTDMVNLGKTFASMDAAQASDVLVTMFNAGTAGANKAISIMKVMDTSSRGKILTEMAKKEKDKAATISSKLAN
ncbi:MotE family protein [Gorillibacterium massiliense]|uniref:MotE family protein n=1 Tax=Gorillibacterium massiliense TaxID=1280390 RepID=UPI0004B14F4C|nr:hypothetical protein [Gorillibacterium massiliense]